jgi:hypothetical protein
MTVLFECSQEIFFRMREFGLPGTALIKFDNSPRNRKTNYVMYESFLKLRLLV